MSNEEGKARKRASILRRWWTRTVDNQASDAALFPPPPPAARRRTYRPRYAERDAMMQMAIAHRDDVVEKTNAALLQNIVDATDRPRRPRAERSASTSDAIRKINYPASLASTSIHPNARLAQERMPFREGPQSGCTLSRSFLSSPPPVVTLLDNGWEMDSVGNCRLSRSSEACTESSNAAIMREAQSWDPNSYFETRRVQDAAPSFRHLRETDGESSVADSAVRSQPSASTARPHYFSHRDGSHLYAWSGNKGKGKATDAAEREDGCPWKRPLGSTSTFSTADTFRVSSVVGSTTSESRVESSASTNVTEPSETGAVDRTVREGKRKLSLVGGRTGKRRASDEKDSGSDDEDGEDCGVDRDFLEMVHRI